jgi:hypothetical protein
VLTQSAVFPNGLLLQAGHLPVAAGEKALLMTVDGVVRDIAPGVYPGRVELTVYDLPEVPETSAELSVGKFRTALLVRDGVTVPTGLEDTAGAYTVEGRTLSHVQLRTAANDFGGIIVDGTDPEPVVIRDSTFRCSGGGTSEGRGATIMTVGEAKVKLDGLRIWNHGTLTAIVASGHSQVEIANSVIYGTRDFTAGKLCPWVLGINGSNRLTNAIDYAQVDYHDSIVVAQSWAALSTDTGKGVRLTGEDLFAGIGRLEPYDPANADRYTATPSLGGERYGFFLGNSAIGECGYVNYADAGFHNSFRNVQFYSPDYVFILSTKQASIDVTGDSVCHSGRVGVLWHKNSGGTVRLTGGKWYAKDCLFLSKSWSEGDNIGCWSHSICEGTDITLGEDGVLYQLMTSDDVGLRGPSRFTVPQIEAALDRVEKLPETYPAQKMFEVNPIKKFPIFLVDGEEVTVEGDVQAFLDAHPTAQPAMYDASYRIHPTDVTFRDLTATGHIFNGVYARIQVLDVTLDNAKITGIISSAHTRHVDENGIPCAPGTSYGKDGPENDHLGIGRVKNTAAPAINNPVHLTLQNGAVWTPAGVSYLEELTVDTASRVAGTVTVDGAPVTSAGTWTGSIVVTPLA